MAGNNIRLIMSSKRANIYYLEHVKIIQRNGSIVYLTVNGNVEELYNIPFKNTVVLLLGPGSSITNAAVRLLADAGVPIGFTGGDGTPFYAGTEIAWLTSGNEYRPTAYMQKLCSFWFDDEVRLRVAKKLQLLRLDNIRTIWEKDQLMNEYGFFTDHCEFDNAATRFAESINKASDITKLLTSEAEFVKSLYSFSAEITGYSGFKRDQSAIDGPNGNITRGNYYAYGLAAATLWTLGLSYSFAVMHGKTRNGGLVFDIADLVKDALIVPLSFIYSTNDFKKLITEKFIEHKILDLLFSNTKELVEYGYGEMKK